MGIFWKHLTSVLRSFNYDKIYSFKFIESRFISFIYRDSPQRNPKFTDFVFLSKQMTEKESLPNKVIENFANYIESVLFIQKGS